MRKAKYKSPRLTRPVDGGDLRTSYEPRPPVLPATMNNRNLLKGLFLVLIALAFGSGSLRYPIGALARAGPGLFPLLVSALLFLLGATVVVRAFLTDPIPVTFKLRNIGLILLGLVGFALFSEQLNMIAGIVLMVFCATLAGTSYSVRRNLMITAGLLVVAFAFQKLLGLQLPLY